MPYVTTHDAVHTLYLGIEGESDTDNRFGIDWLDAINACLDEVVDAKPGALVITATGKFFSNGLDVEYIGANGDKLPAYLDRVHALYTRILTFPQPTVAAINGHAFGAAAMLALCADHRIMRTERGFWSLPEVQLGMPFTKGMATLLRTRLTDATATEAMTTGRRYGGLDSVAAGIVEQAVDIDVLTTTATDIAASRSSLTGPALELIKKGLRAPLLADLDDPTPASLVG
ncbi:enoyl-CoA hydratase/isomerase family protein [Nocardia sp. 348MFTsu5.1]|uniref:enoyl-CoA hydratase/isomerase family protein n=1 Tax=Nocardia sp. 348MFTsu5.1 TaxID=1172185 RepID=UPI00035D476F|nr:enoyl-CoA hydratase/isomerase family protein [Nocardia sp. 348MFTsu5.1]